MRTALKIFSLIFLLTFVLPQISFAQESDAPAKKEETKLSEVITADTVGSSELLARAINWIKKESTLYGKTAGVTTASKAEVTITYHTKPKELRPQCDFTGKITFRVMIECKYGKYRYTVTHIKHQCTVGEASGGAIDNETPECGTMIMTVLTWKKLKGDMNTKAAHVANELKEAMKVKTHTPGKDEW
jgi:hypothetical protein